MSFRYPLRAIAAACLATAGLSLAALGAAAEGFRPDGGGLLTGKDSLSHTLVLDGGETRVHVPDSVRMVDKAGDTVSFEHLRPWRPGELDPVYVEFRGHEVGGQVEATEVVVQVQER